MIPVIPSTAGSASVDSPKPKPKLGFSIDSLVGRSSSTRERSSPSPPPRDSPRSRSSPVQRRSLESPRRSPQLQRRSPDANGDALMSPSMIRFPEPIHPFQQCFSSNPSQGNFSFGQGGFGIPPSMFPLSALLPQHQGFPNSIPSSLLNQVSSLGTPLPPSGPRDHPSYPWLLSRHSRLFGYRFPGPDFPTFLLPFRKPKRIRTAFSPNQLLKLEQAFEKNQYVVGSERKQLAQLLNLSETQVKVWFQNRRTKHKRVFQDDSPPSERPHFKDGSSEAEGKTFDASFTADSESDSNAKSPNGNSKSKALTEGCRDKAANGGGSGSFVADKMTVIEYDEDDALSEDDAEEFRFRDSSLISTETSSFS